MSGDKDFKRDIVGEIYYRARQKRSFQATLEELRSRYGIPAGGFRSFREASNWWFTNGSETFHQNVHDLIRSQKLPLASHKLMEDYVLSDNIFPLLPKRGSFSCEYDQYIPSSQRVLGIHESFSREYAWQDADKPFIRIYIGEDTSLPSLKRFLDKYWPNIRQDVFQKAKGTKVARRSLYSDRDELIWFYYQKSKEDLGVGSKYGLTRDIQVSNILEDEHGIRVSPENVRKIVQRKRQLRDS